MGKRNRKQSVIRITAAAALGVLAAPQVACAASANITAHAAIVTTNVAIDQNQPLNFGTFTTGGAGGTVVVDTAGLATYGGVNEIATTAPTEGIVRVRATAGPNVIMSVTQPTFTVSNGTTNMVINQFHVLTNAGGLTNTFPMTASTVFVPIGATLSVGAAQPAGTYTGSFTVQAVYQ